MATRFSIAYISPNGSTGKVAKTFADQLSKGGATVNLVDISKPAERSVLLKDMQTADDTCLLIGSPVYNDVAVPPVMALIDALPRSDNAWAVPFVTYGKACSGVALWQMATALHDKGFRIGGAAKVVAVHSLMWKSDHPEGEGHPDADDLQQVRRLADMLLSQLHDGRLTPLPLETLDYQTAEMATACKAKLSQPWVNVPKTVDAQACTECGNCVEDCPAAAISLNPLPEFGDSCFSCFNCIRLCPENAIRAAIPMARIEMIIRERVKSINEQPLSQIYLAGT